MKNYIIKDRLCAIFSGEINKVETQISNEKALAFSSTNKEVNACLSENINTNMKYLAVLNELLKKAKNGEFSGSNCN